MFLQSDEIQLRAITRQDLTENYVSWLNDQETCAQNSHGYLPYTMDNLVSHYDSKVNSSNELRLAIIVRNEDIHIGNVSLQNINWINSSAEFAILLGDKKFWGKGFGFKAALLIMHHGFQNLNLHRIYCGTTEENIGMKTIANKIGMKEEGVRRDAFFKNGKYQNIVEYGILKHEFYGSHQF